MSALLSLTWALMLAVWIVRTGGASEPLHPYGKRVFVVGDPVLRANCSVVPIENITHKEGELMEAVSNAHLVLKNFRAKMGFGRALAAPQVGYKLRFIAMCLKDGVPRTLYNPQFTEASPETFTMWDDCLSFPDKMCCVRRHKHVSVQFIDEAGKRQEWTHCSQDLSELLQHEMDHLDGILAIDLAIPPPKDSHCTPIIPREDYLAHKAHYDALVDFHY